MQMKRGKKCLPRILCTVLIVAMALVTDGCGTGNGTASDAETEVHVGTESSAEPKADAGAEGSAATEADAGTEVLVMGEGDTQFAFTVVDQTGGETLFEIHTDEETVGAALLELGLIEGEEGMYGLYVTTVNGITIDYEQDGAYWAFYINGEYAVSGVDATAITEGETYSFMVEKA